MFEQNLRALRKQKRFTQEDLAKVLRVERSTIAKWENGVSTPPAEKLKSLAALFGVSLDKLLSDERQENPVTIPVLGKVQAGLPTQAVQEVLDYEEIPEQLAKQGDFFALQVKGDSMMPRILEGDVVVVRRQNDVESGDIAVVLVSGEEATVKKIIKHGDGISLVAFNPQYKLRFYSNREIASRPVEIVGKVVELRAKF